MRLKRVSFRVSPDVSDSLVCYLVENTWDDFGFRTTFEAVLFDELGSRHDLGFIRILKAGMAGGRVQFDAQLPSLDESYCSLGNDREYYLKLREVPSGVRIQYLEAIRDCAYNNAIFQRFANEHGMNASLLREVSKREVTIVFPRILDGNAELTSYDFAFELSGDLEHLTERMEFSVQPLSKPPSNIHVLIGRNGVGKTRLLAGMADAVTENKAASIGLKGKFVFTREREVVQNEFLNVVIVSYSVFDNFDPIPQGTERTEHAIPHYYLGIKGRSIDALSQNLSDGELVYVKTSAHLNGEFGESIKAVASDPPKLERWLRAIQTLSSDPGINDIGIIDLVSDDVDSFASSIVGRFANLSSGHKTVLLTITKLVEVVSDRSLVLMDEPETHLHPPLLSSFLRALSNLLHSRNAVAIVATHSPVILQEVPSDCVQIIVRSGDLIKSVRPDTETFAENVGTLTRKVFGLEVENSGFYDLLSKASLESTFDDVVEYFSRKVGGEGRALIRALTVEED